MSDRPRLRVVCLAIISLGLIGLEQQGAIAHSFPHPIDNHQRQIWHDDSQTSLQGYSAAIGYRDGLPKRRKGGGSR